MQNVSEAGFRSFRWDLPTYSKNLPYLTHYLSTLLQGIGRVERKVATARYIEGLLMPGRGKFIRPLAERLGVDPQSLQQAVTNSRWDDHQVWSALRSQVETLLAPLPLWIISERAWEKQGNATAGVANQRCGADGKSVHCQLSLEILGSNGAIAMPLAGRLHLPSEWVADEARRERTEIPAGWHPATKPELALFLISEIARDAPHPGMVQGDRTYGNDRAFRSGLERLGIEFLLEVDGDALTAWDFDHVTPMQQGDLQPQAMTLTEIAQAIPSNEWHSMSWVKNHRFTQSTRLAIREVFVDPGPGDLNGTLERLLMVADWPENSARPQQLYLANWHWQRSEAHYLRYLRYDDWRKHYEGFFEATLDLANYQGRSWTGFHHHVVLAAAAYLFVLSVEQRASASFWSELPRGVPSDAAIKTETHRLASILLRSGINVEQSHQKRPSFGEALPEASHREACLGERTLA